MEIKRGEIYFADITKYDSKGSEQSGRRPVVILQNNIGNKFSPTTIIARIKLKYLSMKIQTVFVQQLLCILILRK